MKKLVFVLAGVMFIAVSTLNAKNLPTMAAKLPADLKQEIVDKIDYPTFAEENGIEGDVWMKVAMVGDSEFKVVELSATNQELGAYVKEELSNYMVAPENETHSTIYFVKVNFQLLK